MNFADTFRMKYPKDAFSERDLRVVFRDLSDPSLHGGLSRALAHRDFLKLKRGFYIFGDRLRRGPLSKAVIANRLYSPSYISFESSLSHHGLIPEGVYSTTSASQRREKKRFQTLLGEFTYDYIPKGPFFMGVEVTSGALMANPIKALFDWIYVRRKTYKSLEDLERDMRIEPETLIQFVKAYPLSEIKILAETYQKKVTRNFFELLLGSLT